MTRMEAIRIPPHSVDAEQAVLGGLMIDPRALPKIADWLTEPDFYRKDHQLIFRAVKELVDGNKPCDAVTLGQWFEDNGLADIVGGVGYVLKLANNTPGAANIIAYAEIVREHAIKRTLIDTGTSLASGAFEAGTTSADLTATAMHDLSMLTASTARGGLVPMKSALKQLYTAMLERYTSKAPLIGLPTPWRDLNKVTKGLRKGTLYIIGARPSMGKTILGENIATFNALRGHRVALFSAEMTQDQIAGRACAAHGDIPHDWIDQPIDCDDSEVYWSRISAITKLLMESSLVIDDTPAIRIEQLMARARREHMRKPIELIVIDHLHDMEIDARAEARREYGRIAQGCKTLAKEFDCPVVLLAQLKRLASGKRPDMQDLRESGEIEQKGDVILFIHREDYYTPETHLRGIVELIPAKGRNIKVGESVYLQNRYDRMRLDDLDGPLPEPPPQHSAPRRGGYRSGKGPPL